MYKYLFIDSNNCLHATQISYSIHMDLLDDFQARDWRVGSAILSSERRLPGYTVT
jgi:hypothetical protein